jgi:hypothetical protein
MDGALKPPRTKGQTMNTIANNTAADVNKEILNGVYCATKFACAHDAAIACLVDVLTARKERPNDEALMIAENAGCEALVNWLASEMNFDRDQVEALTVAWADALTYLRNA